MSDSFLRRLSLSLTVLALVAFATACGGTGDESADMADEPESAEMAEPADQPMDMAGLDPAILEVPGRPAEEVAQDADRMPVELYTFFGVEPGMTVADLWPGGGYNTFLLSHGVGPDGVVFAVNGFYNTYDNGSRAQALRERVTRDGLDNVTVLDEITDIPAGSVDVAITVRNYHDIYGFGGDPAATVQAIYDALKPGGIVGVVDVAGGQDGWDPDAHRLGRQTVVDDFTGGGFELADESDMLANPDDDHMTKGFDSGRQKTDRYVLKFRKPQM